MKRKILTYGGYFERFLESLDEKETGNQHSDIQKNLKVRMQISRTEKYYRKDNSDGGNRKSLIGLILLIADLLAIPLQHIEVSQTNQTGQAVEAENSHLPHFIDSTVIADADRKNTETYQVAQGIDLNAEGLLIIGSIFLRPCHLAIEGIQQSGQSQESDRQIQMTGKTTEQSGHG